MTDGLLLVESLDKDWEDSDSEEQNESARLKTAPKYGESCEDLSKPESTEENLLPLENLIETVVVTENPAESFDSSEHLSESLCNTPILVKSTDDGEISKISLDEKDCTGVSVDVPSVETQHFIVRFDADEVTLTPDDGLTCLPLDEAVASNADVEKSNVINMPDIDALLHSTPQNSVSEAAEFVDESENDILCRTSSADDQSEISTVKKTNVKPVGKREKVALKKTVENKAKKQKLDGENTSTVVPSVYSYSEIKRHKKRLTLKALQDDSSSDSDSNTSEDSYDPDLDVNLRIFEGGGNTSADNIIIGEIRCDVVADDKIDQEAGGEKQNKNSNVFKLSVNADFSEKSLTSETLDGPVENAVTNPVADQTDDDDDVDGLCSLYDDDFFSDDDSDLEILTSKSIVRKRASIPAVRREQPVEGEKKTMYDLIRDAVQPGPRQKEKSNDLKSKPEPKKRVPRKPKPKSDTPKKRGKKNAAKADDTSQSDCVNEKETSKETLNETSNELESVSDEKTTEKSDSPEDEGAKNALPVPQLKVNAEGKIIIDTDSLTIEQTGFAAARQAIANSEVVEESGLNYKSYNKKNNYRKQWSPHDTLKFYDVLSVVGTDFTLMATLFPGRTRNCIKRKYKKEEKTNRDLILKALTCKQKFNIGLLEKELKLKEERVNLLKKNAKKEKEEKIRAKKAEPKVVKSRVRTKRKSFFEQGISCFQDS